MEVRGAIARGLAAIERAAARYPEHRTCFSCHHQTLPLLAQAMAGARGFAIDETLRRGQLELTLKSFAHRTESLKQGEGIGGRAMTVAYGLWAAELADAPGDETTEAMATYLLKTQRDEGHWIGQTSRPPLEESYITCTALALRGLTRYHAASQNEAVAHAIAKATEWLATAPAKSQEDKAARLWCLHSLGAPSSQVDAARHAVIETQRDDGGWAQLDEMQSDAYATGQALFVLHATGFDASDAVYRRGARFLLDSQREDGNWLVKSRSRPIQPYYDSDDEDPLGKDQFISVPAACWAVAALAAGE